jgi:hypothetical protein
VSTAAVITGAEVMTGDWFVPASQGEPVKPEAALLLPVSPVPSLMRNCGSVYDPETMNSERLGPSERVVVAVKRIQITFCCSGNVIVPSPFALSATGVLKPLEKESVPVRKPEFELVTPLVLF